MQLNFRQGLVAFQADAGSPQYLKSSSTAGYVALNVNPTPTLVTLAHGGSDYLLKFEATVDPAWGPLPSQTAYLYWDVDQLTTNVSYGITTVEPGQGLGLPVNPTDDQHWFDLSTGLMQVWSAARNKWQIKIRLFAGSVSGGNITMYTAGSNVGLNTPCTAGFIMLDTLLQPLRKNSTNGEFLTDGDVARVLTTVGTSGVLVQPVSRVVPVRAAENIPKMSLVYFYGDDTVKLADSNPALMPGMQPVGMVIDALASGDIGTFVLNGEITYDQWNWEGFAGSPLYSDQSGQVTLVRPAGLLAYRIGYVKNANTILLNIDTETEPHVYTQDVTSVTIVGQPPITTVDVINGIGERVITISAPFASATVDGFLTKGMYSQFAAYAGLIAQNTTDIATLQSTKANVGDAIPISQVTGLQAELDALEANSVTIISPAIAGDFPALTADGHLVDSGFSAASFATVIHTHLIGDIIGLQTALDQKAYRSHLNAISEIYTNVDRTGPFDVGVTPTLIDILATYATTDYVDAGLATKLGLTDMIPISQVTDLQFELDSKLLISDAATFVRTVNGVPGPDVSLTTDNIPEGSTNKWFTSAEFQILFNAAISAASINELADVQTEYTDENNVLQTPQDGQVLAWSQAVMQWRPSQLQVNVTSVNTQVGDVVLTTSDIQEVPLTGVTVPGDLPTNAYFTHQRADEWLGLTSIDKLMDVDHTLSPLPQDVFSWDGAKWTNMVLPAAPVRMVCGYTSDNFPPTGNITLTTSDISEGSNEYWTQLRFDTAFTDKQLVQLKDFGGGAVNGHYLQFQQPVDPITGAPTGTGYWVGTAAPGAPVTSVNGKTGAVFLTADDLGQGTTQQFYTSAAFQHDFDIQFPLAFNTKGKLELLADVAVGGVADGQFLAYNAANKDWEATTVPNALVTSVAGHLGDVTLSTSDITEPMVVTPTSLIFMSTERLDTYLGTKHLGDIGDVILTNQQSNDTILWNGSHWYNTPIPSAPVLTVAGRTGNITLTTDDVAEGGNLYYTQTRFTTALKAANLEGLYNVVSGAKPNQYLQWIAPTDPISGAPTGPGYWTPSYLGHGATPGQYLVWSQSVDANNNPIGIGNWVPGTPPTAPVTSVAGKTGAVTLTTDNVTEGANLYFTNTRVRTALSGLPLSTSFQDVTITSPQTGQVLKWNGVNWVNDVVAVSSAAVISGLGYTPANKAGDSFSGAISSSSTVTGTVLKSTIAQGTAPITVNSTTLVTNLNSQLLNSEPSSYFAQTYMTFALTDEVTTPTVGTAKITFRAPYAITLTSIPRMSLSTAGTNLSSVDIKLAGTSILGTQKLQVDANQKTSVTSGSQTSLAITSVPDDGEITVDITSVGIGALGFKVTIYFQKT